VRGRSGGEAGVPRIEGSGERRSTTTCLSFRASGRPVSDVLHARSQPQLLTPFWTRIFGRIPRVNGV